MNQEIGCLKYGLNAVVFRNSRERTAEERMKRYYAASVAYPYQMRHTFASQALSAGENVMWVAKQMGHRDWTITAKKYARWIPSMVPDAGQRLAAAWDASPTEFNEKG